MRLEVVSHVPLTPTHQTPILFLHGAWHGAWCWEDYFLPYMAQQGFAVHAMSLRAHGLSEGREHLRWVSAEDYVTDLVQVVRSLPQPPVIVGHSFGGYVIQKYLEDYDAPAAVLVAPAPARGGYKFTLRTLRATPGAMLRTTITMSPYVLVNTVERAHATFFSASMPREQVERHFARIQDELFRAYLDWLVFALPDTRRICRAGHAHAGDRRSGRSGVPEGGDRGAGGALSRRPDPAARHRPRRYAGIRLADRRRPDHRLAGRAKYPLRNPKTAGHSPPLPINLSDLRGILACLAGCSKHPAAQSSPLKRTQPQRREGFSRLKAT